MNNEGQTDFLNICRKELMPFLKTFGFVEKKADCHDGSFRYNVENAVWGTLVEFEPRYIYPRLFLYPVSGRDRLIELCEMLKKYAPDLVFPTEKTDIYLTELVRSVLTGVKSPRRGCPENISFGNVITYSECFTTRIAESVEKKFSRRCGCMSKRGGDTGHWTAEP